MIQANFQNGVIEGTEKLTDASIKMANAVNDLGALKVFFAVGLIVIILVGLLAGIVIYNLLRKMNTMATASEKVLEYFNNLGNRTIGKEEGKALVREAIEKGSALTKYYTMRIRWENNIDDTVATENKVSRQVDNIYSEMSIHFSRFICVDKPLSCIIELQEVEAIKAMMINYIYMDRIFYTPSKMSEEYDLYFKGLKITYQEKIEKI